MKTKRRLLVMLCMFMLMITVPVSANAAYTVKKTGITVPVSIKKGSFFNMKGTITCNMKLSKVVCTIYNSTGKTCLQRYEEKIDSYTYNLAKADPYLTFDKLPVGYYYYRICCYNSNNKYKRIVSKKFQVKSPGTIKIVNPVPSANKSIKQGRTLAIGGKITSTYKLGSVTGKLINSSNKVVFSKTVKPNTTTYSLANSPIDNALYFERLAPGVYTYRVNAVDIKGTNVVVLQKKITVEKSDTSTSNTTGSNPYSGNSTYLNYTGTVTVPAGFTPRTSRPASTNKYYYNGTENIYYKYNSLAPTGKAYYGSQYVLGNCTWYACGRAMEIVAQAGGNTANVKAIFGGDPVQIYNTNVNKQIFSCGKTPKIGALAIFGYGASGDAHIAVVENVIGGVPYVSESGYTVSSTVPNSDKSNIIFKYQSIYNWASGRELVGYIYLR